MKNPNQPTKTTDPVRNPFNRSPWWRAFVVPALAFAVGCFALSPATRAVDPPPGGFYPGDNTALGENALFSLTTGTDNVALGHDALHDTTTGLNNTATGDDALHFNIVGFNNTANGWHALMVSTGSRNTATGCDGLSGNTTGSNNTANGTRALAGNTTGNANIALGFQAGASIMTTSNNIDIGNRGVSTDSGTIRIGTVPTHTAVYIAGISGSIVSGGLAVVVGSDGHLGTMVSSERYKETIQPMDKASEAILALKPVTFRYKHELDPNGIPQFGLVAEQVEKVNPDLVARDADGKAYTVRYEAVNAMLLNEFLKEHAKVEQLKKDFESKVAEQQKQIEALTAGLQRVSAQIQKVSDQLGTQAPAPRVVAND